MKFDTRLTADQLVDEFRKYNSDCKNLPINAEEYLYSEDLDNWKKEYPGTKPLLAKVVFKAESLNIHMPDQDELTYYIRSDQPAFFSWTHSWQAVGRACDNTGVMDLHHQITCDTWEVDYCVIPSDQKKAYKNYVSLKR